MPENSPLLRAVFCDSGLGGLDIAADFVAALRRGSPFSKIEVVYFNFWLKPGFAFNQLPDFPTRAEAMQKAMSGVEKIEPDVCFLACNTLSVIGSTYPPLLREHKFPIFDTIEPACRKLVELLDSEPDSGVALLGTLSTIGGNVYAERLRCAGISPQRIFPLPCPGLASQIEYDPDSPEVRLMISRYAKLLKENVSGKFKKIFVALCCTHFGYAKSWQEIFHDELGEAEIINLNREFLNRELFRWCDRNAPVPEIAATVKSKIYLGREKRETIAKLLVDRSPELASALLNYQRDEKLFPL